MGGGYINCGNFMGEDKSGSALSGVLRDLPKILSPAEATIFEKIVASLAEALENGEQELRIASDQAGLLVDPLRRYHAHLAEVLGNPNPYEAPELDRERGMDMTEAKWGEGLGWQFYCTHDLLQACEISVKSGEPILVSFD